MMPQFSWTVGQNPSQWFMQSLPRDLAPLVSRVLWNRGVREPGAVAAFLSSDYANLHDPLLLKGMERAVARLCHAIETGQRVAVYGDFDTDGVTSVVLLNQLLTALGVDVLPYIPHRVSEGYGLNLAAVEWLAGEVQLLITVDCGIANVAEIGRAQALGLDVIVLDHHHPPAELPPAYALVNPHLADCPYPSKTLAGVGIAYKLAQALHRMGVQIPLRGRDLLDVVALGTVSDMMPLVQENRILVKHGLAALNLSQRPGIHALMETAAVHLPVDARMIGYTLGPRLNAAGRLDDAMHAYKLLLSTTAAEARPLADKLNALNAQRQQLTQQLVDHAQALIHAGGKTADRILVVHDERFVAGVVGLVAARLVDLYRRPALVFERGADTSRGSARSIAGFSVIDALNQVGSLLAKHGGHEMAAGLVIHNQQLPAFEAALRTIAERQLPAAALVPRLAIDAELTLSDLSFDLLDQMTMLAPYGQGNPEPVWATRRLRLLDARVVGRTQQHLKLRLTDGQTVIDALWWRTAEHAASINTWQFVDVAYTLNMNEFRGQSRLQLDVRDMRPTTSGA